MKIAICNDVYKDWSWDDVCRDAAEAGYDAIEIAPFTFAQSVESISKQEREKIRNVAAEHGIAIAGLHWLLLGPEGLHLYDPDASAVTKPYLEALAEFCADIGGEVLVFGSPKQRQRPEHLEPERARDLAKKALADWARACHQRGLLLCLEPLTSAETDFIVSAGEAVQLIEEIDEPGLALHLDVRAMLSEELPMEEIIRSYAKYLRHVHVNDAGMIPPGKGETPYEPIVSALKESGYTGYLSVEVFDLQGQEPQVVARESANFLRSFM
ncbi:MAG: sugar phosphate isomerase/epimerase [Firmicutes bacterium]|jgi:sugar phosphate isomerase/epimerase|nr:sugar phosphate isomerase/epimerase [Bacillota bacterium]